jgi:hypothetical protein
LTALSLIISGIVISDSHEPLPRWKPGKCRFYTQVKECYFGYKTDAGLTKRMNITISGFEDHSRYNIPNLTGSEKKPTVDHIGS